MKDFSTELVKSLYLNEEKFNLIMCEMPEKT